MNSSNSTHSSNGKAEGAFGGGDGQKAAVLAALRERWVMGQVLPAWPIKHDRESTEFSLTGACLVSGVDHEAFGRDVGVPLATAYLHEALVAQLGAFDYSGRVPVFTPSFAAEQLAFGWLEGVEPGSRQCEVVPAFAAKWLGALSERPFSVELQSTTIEAAATVAALIVGALSGSGNQPDEWKSARQGACTATDRCASPLDRAVAELAETCAWPPTEPYDEIVNQLLKTLFEVRNHFRQQAMPKAERDHELKMGAVVAAYFHAQSQPGFDERAYFDEHPQAKEAMNMPPPSAQQLLREAEFDRQCVAQMAEMAAADALQFQLLTQNGS